jgi:hypothetical protein
MAPLAAPLALGGLAVLGAGQLWRRTRPPQVDPDFTPRETDDDEKVPFEGGAEGFCGSSATATPWRSRWWTRRVKGS